MFEFTYYTHISQSFRLGPVLHSHCPAGLLFMQSYLNDKNNSLYTQPQIVYKYWAPGTLVMTKSLSIISVNQK